jgi:hypothetical protein
LAKTTTLNRNNPKIFPSLAIPAVILLVALTLCPQAHGQTSDFSLTATPANLCANPGVDARALITLESVGGFTGTINLNDTINPTVNDGPTLSSIPSSEPLAAGQAVSFYLTISTTISTPLGAYHVTVSGLSGNSFHQATIRLTVSAGCSVGGSLLPLDRLSLLPPYVGVIVLTGAIAALMTGFVMYRGRNKTGSKRRLDHQRLSSGE